MLAQLPRHAGWVKVIFPDLTLLGSAHSELGVAYLSGTTWAMEVIVHRSVPDKGFRVGDGLEQRSTPTAALCAGRCNQMSITTAALHANLLTVMVDRMERRWRERLDSLVFLRDMSGLRS